jgi:hypothetical protein
MPKNMVEPEEPQMSQYGAYALHAGWAELDARTGMHTPTRSGSRACKHAQMCNIYCFSTATVIREHASMLRYTYIFCLVIT